MSNNNSNNFQTPEEPKEEPLKFKLLPFGVEHPPNPPRPFYMVESSNPIFPTLTSTEPIRACSASKFDGCLLFRLLLFNDLISSTSAI